MKTMNSHWTIVFYADENGKDSVLDEIDSFGGRDSIKIFKAIELLRNYGTNLSQDRIKHIAGKIWEIRIDRYRVLYFPYGMRQFILVRAFMKKTSKTPIKEIRLAEKRIIDYVSRAEGD